MFGRISVVRRCLVAVNGSKILQTLSRYLLKVVLFPGSALLVLLFILYITVEYTFFNWYFALGYRYVWKPAFPLSWRILLLLLFVVPTFSFLHLLWLSRQYLALVWCSWRSRYGLHSRLSEGYSMLQRSEERPFGEIDVEDGDQQEIEHHTARSPFSLVRLGQFIFWVAVSGTTLWFGLHHRHPGDSRYLPLIEKANTHPQRSGYGNQEKIFIGAMFYNNEKVIPYWSDSIVKAIHYLGADNVFVSIVESNSSDHSPALLRQLDARLDAMHVPRRILTQDETITKPDSLEGNNRTIFLSALRNQVLDPLVESGGYDKVIFSNDIFVEPESILELLYTAEGDYDMVCGMDYGQFGLYDMWVLRDKRGRLASSLWPYFFDAEAYEAMRTESPVPVFTCWNGIVVFKADPVLPIHLRPNRTLSNDPLPFALPATHPAINDPSLRGPSPALTPPLRFRASGEGECFSSECFLLPYDLRRLFDMQRIFVNPRVVVSYQWRFYVYFKWLMRHPVLKWWIEKVYDGAWMHQAIIVVGDERDVTWWDGGDCFPW